jgi:N4-(beta-N-acetylglucosaminyl)-L-asparaginase
MKIISTWHYGYRANKYAWPYLAKGISALDVVELGAKKMEDDHSVLEVGTGAFPNEDGIITLDACIMDHLYHCASVADMPSIKNAVSIARLVMEKTPYQFLVGEGATRFALKQGFKKVDLHTKRSRRSMELWKKLGKPMRHSKDLKSRQVFKKFVSNQYDDAAKEVHDDTFGMLALDKKKHLAGACTTSGTPFKMTGRVGDSPIVGAGLYVDGDLSAATGTGHGELAQRVCGSFLVTQLIREGYSPQEACKEVCLRITRLKDYPKTQIAFMAMDKKGRVGAYSTRSGFTYSVAEKGIVVLKKASFLIKD